MRGKGRVRVAALNRLAPNNAVWVGLRDVVSDVVTTSDKVRVFPVILGSISMPQVGLVLWHGLVVLERVGIVRDRLILPALGTVQGASTDSGGAWPSTSSDRVIVRVRIGSTTPSRRRERDRIMVVSIRVAVTASTMTARAISVVAIKVGVMCSGSGFRGGERYILVELLRATTSDYQRKNEDQYCESDEPYHAKRAGDGSSVAKETFVGVAVHGARGG
jgi:hypothetical protein